VAPLLEMESVESTKFGCWRARPRHLQFHVHRLTVHHRQKRYVQGIAIGRHESLLDLFSIDFEPSLGQLVVTEIHAFFGLDLAHRPAHHRLVHVEPAQPRVPACSDHGYVIRSDLDDRHVEGSAAQVIDCVDVVAVFGAVYLICNGGRRRLVDEPVYIEAGDQAGVPRGGALHFVEVRRHGDDGIVNRLAQVLLGTHFQVFEDEG
jgi:hypothetical protein